MDGEDNATALFEGIICTLVPGNLTEKQTATLIDVLQGSGGDYRPLRESDQQIEDLDSITHIISEHVDFPQYNRALEHGVHVVKPTWITQSVLRKKQAGTRQHSPDPSQYFQDVVVTSADLPEGDSDALVAGVIALGGQYSSNLSVLVTHIVTTKMDNEKCKIARSKGLRCKIVLPHWFDDCLRLGKKINEKPYLFPDPEILRNGSTSAIKSDSTPRLNGAIVATPTGTPTPMSPVSPSKNRKSLGAFKAKQIFISQDLQIADHLRETLRSLVMQGGGAVCEHVDNADIYIGQFRDGVEYVAASKAKKEVANLAWLYHVIQHNRYTNPLSRLLHYPIPRDGIPGFANMRISISNYTGDARIYVENLIKYSGAQYTKTMKQDNTHLVTAHMQSTKCEAAQEWNINIINHLWLEESYAKCGVQTLSNPRYTHFPARTNLGDVAGQTNFDMKRVERVYFPENRASKPPSPNKNASKKGVLMSSSAAPEPAHRPDPIDAPTPVEEEEEEAEDDVAEDPAPVPKARGRPHKANATTLTSKTATPRRNDNKENQSPMLSSGARASKTKALSSLHQQAGDIALFQREMKRKGGVLHGGRRSLSSEEASTSPAPRENKKRTSDEFNADESNSSEEETEEAAKPTKRAKHTVTAAVLPPIKIRMMVTGDDRWTGKPAKESADKNKLRMLGVLLTQDPKDVDVLVAPMIRRTRKFVAALACAPLVVDTSYLDDALDKNKLVGKPALLEDTESEERLGFSLADSLKRAKHNDGKLFADYSIYVTTSVNGGFDTYQEIIKLNGGKALAYQGRTGIVLPKRRLQSPTASGEEYDFVYLVSGVSDPETKLWRTFQDMARKQELRARIVSSDWLLNAAMSQEITWDKKWLQCDEA